MRYCLNCGYCMWERGGGGVSRREQGEGEGERHPGRDGLPKQGCMSKGCGSIPLRSKDMHQGGRSYK